MRHFAPASRALLLLGVLRGIAACHKGVAKCNWAWWTHLPRVGPQQRKVRTLSSIAWLEILRHLAGATSGKSHDLTRASRKTLKTYQGLFEEKSNCKNGIMSLCLIRAGIGSAATSLQARPLSDLPGHRATIAFWLSPPPMLSLRTCSGTPIGCRQPYSLNACISR